MTYVEYFTVNSEFEAQPPIETTIEIFYIFKIGF